MVNASPKGKRILLTIFGGFMKSLELPFRAKMSSKNTQNQPERRLSRRQEQLRKAERKLKLEVIHAQIG